jgi:hypothetical protein
VRIRLEVYELELAYTVRVVVDAKEACRAFHNEIEDRRARPTSPSLVKSHVRYTPSESRLAF